MGVASGSGQARPEAPSVEVMARTVRFVSRYGGLTLSDGPSGAVRFARGQYATADHAEIAWLRRHPSYRVDFVEAPAEGAPDTP